MVERHEQHYKTRMVHGLRDEPIRRGGRGFGEGGVRV